MIEPEKLREAIRYSEVFKGISREQEILVLSLCREAAFEEGAKIYTRGDAADSCFLLIVSGEAVVLNKQEEPFATVGKGGVLGEIGYVNPQHKRVATVVAAGEVLCGRFDMEKLKQKNAALYELLLLRLENISWSRIVESDL